MELEEKQIITTEEVDNNQYIEAINELKRSTVSRDLYDKVKAENKKLLDSVVNGTPVSTVEVKPKADVSQLRKELFSTENNLSNLEYCAKALELRSALIEKGERDPFLPYGEKISPTQQDVEAAERVATVMQECIEYAEGDSEVFTNELMRRTNDVRYK